MYVIIILSNIMYIINYFGKTLIAEEECFKPNPEDTYVV